MKSGYKVLKVLNGKLYSSCSDCRIQYTKNTYQPCNGGPLAVFNTKENAIDFYKRIKPRLFLSRFQIWKIKYKKSDVEKLWIIEEKNNYPKSLCPEGTEFATHVQLVDRIKI